jgi:hypothetical protein
MKRAAVQWGIGRYLYDLEEGWAVICEKDKEANHAKTKDGLEFHWKPPPLPTWALPEGYGGATTARERTPTAPVAAAAPAPAAPRPQLVPDDRAWLDEPGTPAAPAASVAPQGAPSPLDGARCPKCDGGMYDNRATKKNPKAPDFKCKDRSCDGVIWPPRDAKPARVG